MLNNLIAYITPENIYFAANWGVIPFWMLLIFAPHHGFTNFLTQSVFAPLLLATGYIYLSYNLYLEKNIFDSFELYSGLDGLYSVFSNEILLLVFVISENFGTRVLLKTQNIFLEGCSSFG